jgi:DNA-binding response OmpR family regulator
VYLRFDSHRWETRKLNVLEYFVVSARILVCDDEAHIVRAAEIKLRKAGYEVFIATDGREGWDAVMAHSPDLVFTDCQMPYMTGLELALKIKETPETNGLPVLMLTAKGFELSEEVATTKYGIKKIIPKPFSPRALVAEANAILSNTGPASATPSANLTPVAVSEATE